jgi:hypothetical protein
VRAVRGGGFRGDCGRAVAAGSRGMACGREIRGGCGG